MTVLRAHFDGKVLVPTQPVDLPIGQELELQVTPVEPASQPTLLQKLAKLSQELPPNPDAPTDAAAQHDHYLYGLPNVPDAEKVTDAETVTSTVSDGTRKR